MTTQEFLPIEFAVPLANPSPGGLVSATSWTEVVDAPRWVSGGVRIKPRNYGGSDAFGVWGGDWCLSPDQIGSDDGQIKTGTRPDVPDPFLATTLYSYDTNQCGDMSVASLAEVRERAAQNFRLMESLALEREFALRLLADAGAPASAADLVTAVSLLETAFALTNTVGVIHASPKWQAIAANALLISSAGTSQRTPAGHRWCFGGGYVDGLGDTIVGTSQLYGWRDAVEMREATDPETNTFVAIAERNELVAYESSIGAVAIGVEPT